MSDGRLQSSTSASSARVYLLSRAAAAIMKRKRRANITSLAVAAVARNRYSEPLSRIADWFRYGEILER